MKKTYAVTLKAFGLIMGLGVLSLFCVGCASDNTTQTMGERLDDQVLSSQVRQSLQSDPQYKYDGVIIDTFNKVVQLSGFVDSQPQLEQASILAKKVPGVKEVKNNITIKAGKE